MNDGRFRKRWELGEQGSTLILVVMLVSLLLFIPIGAELLKTARAQVKRFANSDSQAVNVARAGLTDAIAWFRNQNSGQAVSQTNPCPACAPVAYPDAAFFPRQANGDTIDESTGLVKEDAMSPFASENKLYYRYEVRRQLDPNNDGVISGAEFSTSAVHDITDQRMEGKTAGQGLVWYIESVGYVFSRLDSTKPFNVLPNKVVGRARVATEISRLNVLPNIVAAVLITNRAGSSIGANCFVRGDGGALGAAWTTATGANNWAVGTRTLGGTLTVPAGTTATITVSQLFGLSPNDLLLMADNSVNQVTDLPLDPTTGKTAKLVDKLTYISGGATFDGTSPLSGNGILVVNGPLIINVPSAQSFSFNGLIQVKGNVTITGLATISGCLVIDGGTLTMTPNGSYGASVRYDGGAVNRASQVAATYRENRSVYHVFSAFKQ